MFYFRCRVKRILNGAQISNRNSEHKSISLVIYPINLLLVCLENYCEELSCSAGYNKRRNEQTMLASRLFNTLEKGIWINEIQDRLDHQGKQYAIARAQIADLCRRYETEERLCTFRNEFESCKSLEIDRWLKPLTSINVRVYICIYIYIIYQSIITRIIRHRLE